MIEINKEIIAASRCVLTNFAIEKNPWVNGKHKPQIGYSAYLIRENKKTFDMEDRIFRVSDEAAGQFFLYRALPVEIEKCTGAVLVTPEDEIMTLEEFQRHKKWRLWRTDFEFREKDGVKQIMEYDTNLYTNSGGMLVLIDEAWKFWGSRNWQTTGNGVIFYGKQHRKVADDFYICTQSPKDIDAAIVRIAQEFWLCQNRGLKRIGAFRQNDDFKVSVYESAPSGGAQQVPMHSWTFKLDLHGLAQCYDTSAGVGLAGRMAGDIGKKKRGLNFKWLWVLMIVAPVVIFFLLHYLLTFGARKTVAAFVPQVQPGSNFIKAVSLPIGGMLPGFGISPPADKKAEIGFAEEKIEPVFCVGYMLGKNPVCFLSDGRTAEAEFGEVQKIYRHSVVCFGTNYPMVLKPRGQYLPAPAVADYSLPVSSLPVPEVNRAEILGSINPRQLQAPPSTGGFQRQLTRGFQR
jgi:hypothetical protein